MLTETMKMCLKRISYLEDKIEKGSNEPKVIKREEDFMKEYQSPFQSFMKADIRHQSPAQLDTCKLKAEDEGVRLIVPETDK